jgi:hypothetical protein
VVSSSVSEAAKVIETEQPQTLQAPEQDVVLAKNAKVVEQQPDPAPRQDVAEFASLIDVPNPLRDGRDRSLSRKDAASWTTATQLGSQWGSNPSWVTTTTTTAR